MTPDWQLQSMDSLGKRIKRMLAVAVGCGIALGGVASARATSGEELFVKYCALCHGKDGKAQNPAARKLGVKDLSESKSTDSELEKQVIEGKKDDRGNLKMPSFKDKFTPEEIKSLIAVVKSFRK
jgi:cytochrome c6